METLRADELEQALRRMRHLSDRDRAAVEEFSKLLMYKFLHAPTVGLRTAATSGRDAAIADAVRYLFGFEPSVESEATTGAVVNVNLPSEK
jgi:glutamyl-tRNA reductase